MPHKDRHLLCKYTYVSQKEALVSPAVKKMLFLFFMFTILCLAKYVVPRTGGATVPHFVTACGAGQFFHRNLEE